MTDESRAAAGTGRVIVLRADATALPLPDCSIDAIVTDPPYGLGFMGKEWDSPGKSFVQRKADRRNTFDHVGGNHNPVNSADAARTRRVEGQRFGAWCEEWARECLRVLKPGGHLLAFGSTRTYHRLACGVEDAGFEVRDSLHWIYGSGFPKGRDIAKKIDRRRDDRALGDGAYDVTAPASDAARQWEGWNTSLKPAHEPVIWAHKPFSPVFCDWRLVTNVHHALAGLLWLSLSPAKRAELSSPSRNHEPGAAWCASARVNAALDTSPGASGPTATFSSQALASTSLSIARSWSVTLGALSGKTRTSTTSTASSMTTALRILNSLLAPVTSQTTMPECGCLLAGQSSAAPSADETSNGGWQNWTATLSTSVPASAIESTAHAVATALASIAEPLSGGPEAESSAPSPAQTGQATQAAASRPASASGAAETTSQGAATGATAPSGAQDWRSSGAERPAHEPIIVARKSTGFHSTVANVLQHGTGALNIDGCRVACDGKGDLPATKKSGAVYAQDPYTKEWAGRGEDAHGGGRWPPNVLLSGEAAAELDRQSGTLTSGANPARRSSDKFRDAYGEFAGQEECTVHRGADSGGASRFFPVFRYEAKAPASERPRLPDGTAWPTVKPLELVQWLVRLVTPPGGTVLDPFCGTGTTGQACAIEGYSAILSDRDPQALALTRVRLARPVQPVMFDLEAS